VNNPYAQVALTYLRRPFSSLWAGLIILFAIGMIFMPAIFMSPGAPMSQHLHLKPHESLSTWFPMFLNGTMFLFALAAIHIKEQFADPRARLLPDFWRAHVAAAGAAALVLAVLLPAALSAWIGLHSIGLVAVMACWFGLIFWGVLLQSGLLCWMFAIVVFAGILWGKDVTGQLCSGYFEPQAAGILGLGLVTTLLGGLRLVRLNEDMPEYHLRFQTGWAGRGQTAGGAQMPSQGWRARLQASQMAGLTRHAQRAAASPWSRVCRWQVGMMTGWSVLWIIGILFLYLVFFDFIVKTQVGNYKPPPMIAMPVMMFTIMSAAMVWGALWRRRTQTLPYEFLLPVDRAAYLKQVGLAAALNQFQLWIILCVVVVLWQQFAVSQSSPFLMNVLAYSFLCQVGLFGVGAYILRFRSQTLALLGGMVMIQILVIPPIMTEQGPLSSWRHVMLWAAGGFAAMGLLLTWDAYRRWLKTDFD